MYTEQDLQTLRRFAESHGYNHIFKIKTDREDEEVYLCKDDFMMAHPKAKCGLPKIATITNGIPRFLEVEEVHDVCRRTDF